MVYRESQVGLALLDLAFRVLQQVGDGFVDQALLDVQVAQHLVYLGIVLLAAEDLLADRDGVVVQGVVAVSLGGFHVIGDRLVDVVELDEGVADEIVDAGVAGLQLQHLLVLQHRLGVISLLEELGGLGPYLINFCHLISIYWNIYCLH